MGFSVFKSNFLAEILSKGLPSERGVLKTLQAFETLGGFSIKITALFYFINSKTAV